MQGRRSCIAEPTILACCLRIVVRLTERLMIQWIPHQPHISAMRDDVIGYLTCPANPLSHALDTQRVLSQSVC